MNKLQFFGSAALGAVLSFSIMLAVPLVGQVDKDVKKDINLLQTEFEQLENLVKTDIRRDVDLIKKQLGELHECGCKPEPAQPVLQWYQSSTNPEVMYYGYVKDGILYYKFWSFNGTTVKAGANDEKKTTDFKGN